ncbi:methyltransferase [Microbispora sp. NPDC049125]|uniref:class I SAM-dependent methyltransferase n=1 Tax=Microbispora sp. NPDC049125 TaxID=3154929 RepID=UPI003466A993
MEQFVRAHTRLVAVPYVPEIRLHLAAPGAALTRAPTPGEPERAEERDGPLYEIWERTGRLPFWAYAWPGGQALARHLLDNPGLVRGRTVLDVATGSGLVAVAAALAGAATVVANDIDPHALAAAGLNARANGVEIGLTQGDLLDGAPSEDVVLAGDVYYEKPLATRMTPFLARAPGVVLVGAPERSCSYLPAEVFEQVAVHDVPASLETSPTKRTTIWRYVTLM